jgi:hypothetical protein
MIADQQVASAGGDEVPRRSWVLVGPPRCPLQAQVLVTSHGPPFETSAAKNVPEPATQCSGHGSDEIDGRCNFLTTGSTSCDVCAAYRTVRRGGESGDMKFADVRCCELTPESELPAAHHVPGLTLPLRYCRFSIRDIRCPPPRWATERPMRPHSCRAITDAKNRRVAEAVGSLKSWHVKGFKAQLKQQPSGRNIQNAIVKVVGLRRALRCR